MSTPSSPRNRAANNHHASLQPPGASNEGQQPSGSRPSTPSVASAYPSVRDDFIGSYYYGRYDTDFASTVSRDVTRAGPSNLTPSPSNSSLALPPGAAHGARFDDSQHDRDFLAEPPSHRIDDGADGSVDLGSWHHQLEQSFGSSNDAGDLQPAATDVILASPEELQRSDYFAHPGPSLSGTPAASIRSFAMGSSAWNASQPDVGGPSPPTGPHRVYNRGNSETEMLRPRRQDSNGVDLTPAGPTAYTGQNKYFASPTQDVEDEADDYVDSQQLPRRSSAEIMANAGGDTPAMRSAKAGLNRFSKSMRRISRRVVDLGNQTAAVAGGAGGGGAPPGHIRLVDDHDSSDGENRDDSDDEHVVAAPEPTRPASLDQDQFSLRGRSLGFMGPNNRFRRSMAKLLGHWWVEPLLLVVIVANLVFLVIQSSRNVFDHPRQPEYYNWEDMALLGIFCIYTIEIVARIVVSGLVINPPALYQPAANASVADVATPEVETKDTESFHRRRMSKSNTLDAWTELGGSLKNRAQQVLHPQEPGHRRMPTRQSTMGSMSKMSAFEASGDSGYHRRTGTMASGKMSLAPSQHLGAIKEDLSSGTPTADSPSRVPGSAPTSSINEPGSQESSKILRAMREKAIPFSSAIIVQRAQTNNYAYLRHSWNRVDLIAVVSFWISFILAVTGQEMAPSHHIYIFKALSVLRVARLLTITSGTSTILQSLKLAAPLLSNVLFFTLFAMILFSIIGIQSFKGSYRRSCVWVGDINEGINNEPGSNYTLSQLCGGWFNGLGQRQNHIQVDGRVSPISAKGFLCPFGQMCVEADTNPFENSQSFDNIFTSLLEIVILISSNGWSGVMYNMIDADFFVSSLFFIFGLILLNFWLANLFVAVITNSFATISSQTHQSAFSNKNIDEAAAGQVKEEQSRSRLRRKKVANVYKRFWGYTYYFWLLAIIGSLGLQATGASYNTDEATQMVVTAELYFTIAFDCEIVLRFLSYLLDDDWRSFFKGHRSGRNKVDLALCVITSIIQIPAIKQSAVYPWLTIFQLQRFYRVIIAVPRMERLLLRVFGSLSGLLNMILFLLLMVGLAALMAVQLFRGDIQETVDGESNEMTFKQLYNSYLAMYQIFSSENWNDVLFDVINDETPFKQAVIAGIFIGGWFLFANFIVLQMFIAVINEGFSFSEAERRRQQLDHYLKRIEPTKTSLTGRFLHALSPYRYLKARNAAILNQSSAGDHSVDSHTEAIARSMDGHAGRQRGQRSVSARQRQAKKQMGKKLTTTERILDRGGEMLHTVRRILRLDSPEDRSVPLDTVRQRAIRASLHGNEMLQARMSARQPSMYEVAADDDAAARVFARERQLNRMRSDLGLLSEKPTQREIDAAHIAHHEESPRIAMAKAINEHPSFDKSLWLFSNHSRFRRFCQSMVPAAHGERIFGRQHSPRRLFVSQVIIFIAIVGSVVVAGVASPLYRKDWYGTHGFKRDSWFSLAELFLSLVFFVEFAIKVVADGFAFTPNAYLLSPWNLLDLLVLATLVVNVTTELVVIGGVSRFTRALKAFRALRLINLSARMRSTFENLIIGGGRFVDASILAILYIIPFAVWGQNLFSGLLYSCTDTSNAIAVKSDCVGEYYASPSQWTFLAPRVWENPVEGSAYSFDDFKSALLILFEIVSLEGWINVMQTAMAIVGKNQQPSTDAQQVNALFFVIYNLIGAVFVLTLFVSVIIEGFQSATGAAFFSTEQRQWIDLKRLIARQRPSKRPAQRPTDRLRRWCYDRATRKHDWWSRMMTTLYVANIITLCTQAYNQQAYAERIRDGVYLFLAIVYGFDVLIRLAGLGWNSFRRSAWCIFDSIIVVGIIANSIPLISTSQPVQANIQLQKVFLTAATLKLVAKHNGLNQLLKTAVSGLPAIVSLLGLWLCFFFFFAIMFVEIFGLTKWGYIGPETYAKNFSSLPLTLIFLSMMTTGEGWNGYMHDYTVEPPQCTPSANYLETDCGSTGWAYFLFIAWNVTSMYIFLNMFTGTVVENFSYIFQLGGKPILGREDMRGFKKAWFDIVGTGRYLPKDKFTAFFAALPGKFELRMYPDELALPVLREAAVGDERASMTSLASTQKRGVAGAMSRLRAASPLVQAGSGPAFHWPPPAGNGLGAAARRIQGINVKRLQNLINYVDPTELQERRERFNRIYHEACIVADSSTSHAGSVSFHEMLTLIAHYKLIDDDVALGPQELLDRRVTNERIDDRINLERVRGVMATTYLRYRFNLLRAERQRASAELMAAAAAASSQGHHSTTLENVPIITVGDDDDGEEGMRSVPTFDEDQAPSPQGRQRPGLRLDTSSLVRGRDGQQSSPSSPSSHHLRTTPDGLPPGAAGSSTSLLLLGGGGASGSSAGHSSSLDHASSLALGSVPSFEELERRASPQLERLNDSAWGKMMRRVSVVARASGGSGTGSGGGGSRASAASGGGGGGAASGQRGGTPSSSPGRPWAASSPSSPFSSPSRRQQQNGQSTSAAAAAMTVRSISPSPLGPLGESAPGHGGRGQMLLPDDEDDEDDDEEKRSLSPEEERDERNGGNGAAGQGQGQGFYKSLGYRPR